MASPLPGAGPGLASAGQGDARDRILAVLDAHHVMSLATNRPDGWPQVTLVNYLQVEGALYCLIARDSQKFANIQRDGRVSIAVGGGFPPVGPVGLSMSALASEVVDPVQVRRLNTALWNRPAGRGFAPHPASHNVAMIEARPQIIVMNDYTTPPGRSDVVDWTAAGPTPSPDAAP